MRGGSSVGVYDITAVLSGTNLADYVVNSNLADLGTLTVNPSQITLTANSVTKDVWPDGLAQWSDQRGCQWRPDFPIFASGGVSASAAPGVYRSVPRSSTGGTGKLALDYVVVSNLADVGTITVNDAAPTGCSSIVQAQRQPKGAVSYTVTFQ